MKYLIAVLLVGMMFFAACADSEEISSEDENGEPVYGDESPETGDSPETNNEPEEPESNSDIDDSIIGDESGIDTEGAEDALNDW